MKAGPRSGFVKATFSITPTQRDALLVEARRRADRATRFRLDASELVREALDLWIARASKAPHGR